MPAPSSRSDAHRRRMACMACRTRKVKCIPSPTQRCERCTTLGITSCVYEPAKEPGTRNTLGMREACIPCRAKKRKCDAKRPCTRCVYAERALECEYEVVDSISEDIRFITWDGPDPSGSDDIAVQEHKIVGGFPEVFIESALVAIAKPAPKVLPPARALIRSFSRDNASPHLLPNSQPHTVDNVNRILLPPVSVLSSFRSPRVPPEPHVTLLSLGTGRFQLSDAALGELDMKFRLRILCRLNKLGTHFTSKRQQALLRGDTSGTVINPFFVHAAQSLGMHFCEGMDDSPAMIRLQAKHLQMSLESIADVFRGHDQELIAQYVVKACEAIDVAGLQFIPTYGRPPAFSDDLHEKLSLLCQAIYLENFVFLTHGGAEPTMTAGLEKEFRHRLQDVYPVLFRICPLTMRTQAILLVRDTVVILNHRPTEEPQLSIWRQSCRQLVCLLDSYSQTLLFNLQRFQELGDKGGAGVIRSSCVCCLAHLAVLCKALGQPETLWDSALERLGELTGDMSMEEFTRLDLLLGASWEKALEVFDARLAAVPPEDGKNLRHWKEVVAGASSDFAAKLPDAELPTLVVRASWEDGRTEESRYPNLLLRGIGQQYGL